MWSKIKKSLRRIARFCERYKKIVIPIAVVIAIDLLVQIFYPSARLLPFTYLGGENFGLANKSEAIIQLDQAYNSADVEIFFDGNEKPYLQLKPVDIGLSVGNAKSVGQMEYPWYMRIVPTSILWYGLIYSNVPPDIGFSESRLTRFIAMEFGDDCNIEPVNASLEMSGTSLRLIKASQGGICDIDDVHSAIAGLSFDTPNHSAVRIEGEIIEPDVTNSDAQELASSVGTKLLGNLSLSLGGDYGTVELPADELAGWLSFEVVSKKLIVVIDSDKSSKFFEDKVAPIVSQAAGVSIVTSNNLTETTRENGAEGKMINIKETVARIADYLMDQRASVDVAIQSIEPTVEYARNFDPTSEGISSYIKYFAQTHNGKFGVQLVEIDVNNRRASYDADRQFATSSAGRLVLGYEILSGQEQNLSVVSGDNYATCFNEVVRQYKLDCVNGALFAKFRQDQGWLGLGGTTLGVNESRTTAGEIAWFLSSIYNYNIRFNNPVNRDVMLGSVVYAEPDVRIVNVDGKSYILAILTEGVKSADVAELAKQIDDFIRR
ncbi:hypothetical protein FACS189431_2250 [Alphaproteobacteria bacterium]|nr:hypothetical protein FACS189431_2250 [Alphaproteobacteria bacterium]